jgi:hypothetical protein
MKKAIDAGASIARNSGIGQQRNKKPAAKQQSRRP